MTTFTSKRQSCFFHSNDEISIWQLSLLVQNVCRLLSILQGAETTKVYLLKYKRNEKKERKKGKSVLPLNKGESER